MWRMDLKAALLATVTSGAVFLIAACGGGASDSTQSQPVSSGGTPAQSPPVSSSNVGSGAPAQCPVSSGNVRSGTPAQYIVIDLNCSTCSSSGGSGRGGGDDGGAARRIGIHHRGRWRGAGARGGGVGA